MHLAYLREICACFSVYRIVAYSTCSFNPIENEAVVCAALVGARAEVDAQRALRKQARKGARQAARMKQSEGGNQVEKMKEDEDDEDDEDEDDDEPSLIPDEFEVVPAFGASGPPHSLRVAPGLTHWKVPLIPGGPTARRWGPALHTSAGSHYGGGGNGSGEGPGACYAFQRGECRRGDKCRFSHATATISDAQDSNTTEGVSNGSENSTISASDESSIKPSNNDEAGWWSEDLETYLARGAATKAAAAAASPDSSAVSVKAQPHHPKGLKRSMFPAVGAYARINHQLRHACRLLPHFHDGGGFFVCLIQRRHAQPKGTASDATAADTSGNAATDASASPASTAEKPSAGTKTSFEDARIGAVASEPGPQTTDSAASESIVSKSTLPAPGVLSPIDGGIGGEPWTELASFYGLSNVALGRGHSTNTPSDEGMVAEASPTAALTSQTLAELSSTANSSQLCMEGPRVVLCSAGLVRFLARLDAATRAAASAGGSGYHPSLALHSAGLRVFLKMSDGAFRSAAICR